jgi:hypothetical protein
MKITFGQGLTDVLGSEAADGFVTDCSGFRFRGGFAELVGGTTSTGVSFTGNDGGSLAQLYTSANTYVVCSTNSAVGVYTVGGSTTPTAITRKTEGAVISSATAAGTTVTITTATNHGLVTTDVISVWGFNPSTYNAESVAVTRISATVFTYVVASAPAVSPATNFGMFSVAGNSHTRVYRGGELSGVLILNSTTGGCYYWGGNTAIPIRKVVGSYTARVSVPFGNYIVQLAPTIDSVEYPFRICWSNAAEPGTVPHNGFTAALTNQAGDVDKPEIGEMVWAQPLGDDLIVYGTKGRLVMRYTGGNDVFKFTKLPGDEGLYDARMVADFPGGHVFVDRDRHIRVHSGGVTKDISIGRVQNILGLGRTSGSGDAVSISWVVSHARQNEVWIGYIDPPVAAGFRSSDALIWNWENDTWGKAPVSNKNDAISVRSNTTDNLKLYSTGGSLSAGMVILDDNAVSISTASYIERAGIDAGSADTFKNLQRSRWALDTSSSFTPTCTVYHGSSNFSDTAPTYATGVSYTPGTTDYCNARATGGRYLAVKLEVTTAATPASFPYYQNRVRSADLDFTTGGKR